MSDNNKVLCINTDKIPVKTTKSTQGVQVMALKKKGSALSSVILKEECELNNPDLYRVKNIPAAGSFLKKDDMQMSLI